MTEEELWNWMMDGNYPPGYPDRNRPELVKLNRRAFATLSRDVTYESEEEVKNRIHTNKKKPKRNYRRKKNKEYGSIVRRIGETRTVLKTIPAGTKVKVVMASRMGDVGITTNLKAEHGYSCRITCTESESILYPGLILEPSGLLVDIEPIEDPSVKNGK